MRAYSNYLGIALILLPCLSVAKTPPRLNLAPPTPLPSSQTSAILNAKVPPPAPVIGTVKSPVKMGCTDSTGAAHSHGDAGFEKCMQGAEVNRHMPNGQHPGTGSTLNLQVGH